LSIWITAVEGSTVTQEKLPFESLKLTCNALDSMVGIEKFKVCSEELKRKTPIFSPKEVRKESMNFAQY
jgi:hypothetical protein